jgi:hypothetical protein
VKAQLANDLLREIHAHSLKKLAILLNTDGNYDLRVVVFFITDEKPTFVCATLIIVTHLGG